MHWKERRNSNHPNGHEWRNLYLFRSRRRFRLNFAVVSKPNTFRSSPKQVVANVFGSTDEVKRAAVRAQEMLS